MFQTQTVVEIVLGLILSGKLDPASAITSSFPINMRQSAKRGKPILLTGTETSVFMY
jgi:hypothetical protein